MKAEPLPVPPEQEPQQRKSLFRVIGVWLGLLRDYTAADLLRLKEAGVQKVEAQAKKDLAEAAAKLAEAAEKHANAELRLSEAEKNRAEASKIQSEGNAKEISSQVNLVRAETEQATAYSEATQDVVDAISRVKQQGGQVAFDKQELLALLQQGRSEFPDDTVIEDAAAKSIEVDDDVQME